MEQKHGFHLLLNQGTVFGGTTSWATKLCYCEVKVTIAVKGES